MATTPPATNNNVPITFSVMTLPSTPAQSKNIPKKEEIRYKNISDRKCIAKKYFVYPNATRKQMQYENPHDCIKNISILLLDILQPFDSKFIKVPFESHS